jgi:mannose-1-phosphate guanylyltransferase / phosphomannomutase
MILKQAVILCGGKGTRLGAEFSHIPKPLVPVDGIPLLDHILNNAVKAGAKEVILAAGHLGEKIRERYLTYNPWGIQIHTHIEATPLGTAGCLHEIAELLDENFILLYGDVFLDFDLAALLARHEREKPVATVLVRQSDHPKDSDLVSIEVGTDHVLEFLPKATRDPAGIYRNCGNAAVYACSKELLDFIPQGVSTDIATHTFPAVLAAGKQIRAHELEDTGYVKDMGTPARLVEVERYWRRRNQAQAALKNLGKIRAVILDRDGVILRDHGPTTDPDLIEFIPSALDGLAKIEKLGLTCLVATNQPWIARGLLTIEQLQAVHTAMSKAIRDAGGNLTEIIYSPYHPETHHGEGVSELRRASECRKPRPGMLFELMERHGLSPTEVVMVGDSRADILAARNAGVRSILIGSDPSATAAKPTETVTDLVALADLLETWNLTKIL